MENILLKKVSFFFSSLYGINAQSINDLFNPIKVYHIGQQDLQALDSFVNKKKFLFGDKPSSEDSVLFAFISQVVYYDKGPLNKFLKGLAF